MDRSVDLPSRAFADREEERFDFLHWQRSIDRRWLARYPAGVRQFRTSFYTA